MNTMPQNNVSKDKEKVLCCQKEMKQLLQKQTKEIPL